MGLTYITVKTSSQAATTDKVAELMAAAHELGYEASSGALVASEAGFTQTIWFTAKEKNASTD